MKWNHLPVAGGLADQHPEFIDKVKTIFAAIARREEADRKKQEAEMKRNESKTRSAGRARRR